MKPALQIGAQRDVPRAPDEVLQKHHRGQSRSHARAASVHETSVQTAPAFPLFTMASTTATTWAASAKVHTVAAGGEEAPACIQAYASAMTFRKASAQLSWWPPGRRA